MTVILGEPPLTVPYFFLDVNGTRTFWGVMVEQDIKANDRCDIGGQAFCILHQKNMLHKKYSQFFSPL